MYRRMFVSLFVFAFLRRFFIGEVETDHIIIDDVWMLSWLELSRLCINKECAKYCSGNHAYCLLATLIQELVILQIKLIYM